MPVEKVELLSKVPFTELTRNPRQDVIIHRNIEKIMGLLDIENHPFPSHLNLDEQGTFILGYYHQRASFFVPGDNGSPVDESQTNQDSI